METNILGYRKQLNFLGFDIKTNLFNLLLVILITFPAAIINVVFLFVALQHYTNFSFILLAGILCLMGLTFALFIKFVVPNVKIQYAIGRICHLILHASSFYYLYTHSLIPTNFLQCGLALFIFSECINTKKVPNTLRDLFADKK